MRATLAWLPIVGLALLLYLALWPVPVAPVAWQAPEDAGFTGAFAANNDLRLDQPIDLGGYHGVEDLAASPDGRLFGGAEDGTILQILPTLKPIANTGGRPLGIAWSPPDGTLVVADAMRGLLRVSLDGGVTILANQAGGIPIAYADHLDVSQNGTVYFSDASTKFAPANYGGTYEACRYDLMEHAGHGRLLRYRPKVFVEVARTEVEPGDETEATGETTDRAKAHAGLRAHMQASAQQQPTTAQRPLQAEVLLTGLQFANGVALSQDESFLVVAETGNYRLLRYWLQGAQAGQQEVLVDNLPGFPDNLSTGPEGLIWAAMISPRSAVVDALAGKPMLRQVVMRLPRFVQPDAQPYNAVIAVDAEGQVVHNLQRGQGALAGNSTALRVGDKLYLGSLTEPTVYRGDYPQRLAIPPRDGAVPSS